MILCTLLALRNQAPHRIGKHRSYQERSKQKNSPTLRIKGSSRSCLYNTKIRKAWQTVQKSEVQIPLTSDEVVSLIVEAKLTKRQYMLIRKQAKEKHVDIYPSYHKVLEAKNRCYPPINCITITE
jgi:hypothetical protein